MIRPRTSPPAWRERFLPLAGTATVLALLPEAGLCQGANAVVGRGENEAAFVAALIALIALGSMVWQRRRLRREAARAEASEARAERLAAILRTAPTPCCRWGPDPAGTAEPAFARLLGREHLSEFEDIERALQPADAAELRLDFARLRADGAGFTRTVQTADGVRSLEMIGRRGARNGHDGPLDVLWARDVTEAERERLRVLGEQATLAASRDGACAMLDALPVPVWSRHADRGLAWANAAYCRAANADLATVLEQQWELAADAIGEGGRALSRRAAASGEPQTETHHLVVAGERRLLRITETPLPAESVEDRRLVGYALDLTAVEELQLERQRIVDAHAEVLEQLKSAIAIFGVDKRLIFFNSAYVQLWGFDEHWLDTRPTLGEILEDLRERRRLPEVPDFPAFKQGQFDQFTSLLQQQEDLMHLSDGTTLRAVITPHPLGGLMYVLEDVTSALALESSYNTLMAVQRETLDNLAEGIAVFGGDGRLRLSNPPFAALWQLGPEDLAGQPHVTELIARTKRFFDAETEWPERREMMLSGALDRQGRRARFRRKDGAVIEYSAVPLPDGNVLNSFLDVTDSAQVEQALRATNEALETADRLKSEFIANVSYQLRTPLNAIMGFAEILNNQYFGPLTDRQIEYTQSIIDASQRLLALINDILDLATIEAGYMALERKQVDVHELLSSVYELTREWAAKQNLQVTIESAPEAGRIDADERRLKQALYNLVSNAIKFTLPGGTIVLRSERREEDIALIVQDTGIGIPAADRDRVFGRFERAHPQLRLSGVGLGLALVKSFIEMHGGRVDMQSETGRGTTVTCLLPCEPTDPRTAGTPRPMIARTDGEMPGSATIARAAGRTPT